MATTTFRDLIAANKRKSVLLVAVFVLFTTLVVMAVAWMIAILATGEVVVDWRTSVYVGLVAAAITFVLSLCGYYGGSNMILGISGARPLRKSEDPELFNVVEEMAIAAGIPMPKVYIINDSAPNAFATGRDPKHAAVAITTGLRQKLTRDELQGVIAHEIAHIRNYDIRLMLLLAVLVGTIVMLADFMLRILLYSGSGRRSSSRGGGKGGGAAVIVLLLIALVLAVVAPILAQIIQLAVSRQREYLADATGVQLTRNPLGLANALRKIDADTEVLETANRGTAHLYIANPIKKFEKRASSIFSSHPPIGERIRRLEMLLV